MFKQEQNTEVCVCNFSRGIPVSPETGPNNCEGTFPMYNIPPKLQKHEAPSKADDSKSTPVLTRKILMANSSEAAGEWRALKDQINRKSRHLRILEEKLRREERERNRRRRRRGASRAEVTSSVTKNQTKVERRHAARLRKLR